MGYYIDLASISMDTYKKILKSADLIPSWMILKENINDNLDRIKNQNIRNLAELQVVLKDKEKLQQFAKQSDLSEGYLSVLRRVINGYQPKPNQIKNFPETSEEIVLKLKQVKIRNTRHLFDKVLTPQSRRLLSEQTGIDEKDVLRLTKLTDLSRIRWVNHTFAYVLYEAGYDTAEKMAGADPTELYETVKQLNAERKLYNAHIGVHDMKLCIEAAKGLSFDIEYEKIRKLKPQT
ncbi:MAG: DUF4332 domain-containing protein [Reichenbachiella sp.]|uniref:DUF4332 domain-containing protein n=1 Tax=Reichenbachiella sp. TaxID=2184521 RepID=UPI0032632581